MRALAWLVVMAPAWLSSSPAVAAAQDKDHTVAELIDQLRSADAPTRMTAAQLLANKGPDARPAAPALIACLDDADADVRNNAAKALGWVGDPAALPALRAHSGDKSALVRGKIGLALAELGSPADGIPLILPGLSDPDPVVAGAAVWCANQYWAGAVNRVASADELKAAWLEAEETGVALGEALRHPDAGVREQAAQVLCVLLSVQNSKRLASALRTLGVELPQPSPDLVGRMVDALSDPEPGVRRLAANGLGEAGPAAAAVAKPALARLAESEDATDRVFAALALARLGDLSVPLSVAQALMASEERRSTGLLILSLIGPRAAALAPAARALLPSDEPWTRFEAAWTLVRLGSCGEALPVLLELSGHADLGGNFRSQLLDALSESAVADRTCAEEVLPFLLEGMRAASERERMTCAETLVAIGKGTEARDALTALSANATDVKIRLCAGDLLAKLGGVAAPK
jgi:HEAT repeat protein